MKKRRFGKMLAWLSRVLACPVCNSRYSSESTKILGNQSVNGEEGGSVLIHSDCQNCRSSVIFNVTMLGQEIFSIGLISDLTAADAVKFRQAAPISCDEILSFHNFLESFDGNFEAALTDGKLNKEE